MCNSTSPIRPGAETWYVLHKLALNADTRSKAVTFCATIRSICTVLGPSCSDHCKQYVTVHPPEKYVDVLGISESGRVDAGVFLWLWEFHNAVNDRLGKPTISYEEALSLYVTGQADEGHPATHCPI